MRIATWNVNSVKQRLENLLAWLGERQPDIVCLQETKCVDEAFPARGDRRRSATMLQCTVKRPSTGSPSCPKRPSTRSRPRLPGDPGDDHARFLEAVVSTERGRCCGSIYLPNGNPRRAKNIPTKIKWMDRLIHYARERLALEEPLVLAGDYNVIPTATDARNPAAWVGDALFLPQTREKFRALCHLGLTDAVRAGSDAAGLYTFWDYQAGAWPKNNGIRIDHILLSPQAADRLVKRRHRPARARLGKAVRPRAGRG